MKKRLMLIVPMLHQGGFERVCVNTARLMENYYDVTIVIFSSLNIAYDVTGLNIIDLQMGAQQGSVKKIFNVIKRSKKLRELKKEMKPDIAYSFGPTANMVNAFSKTKETKVWLGIRSYMDLDNWFMLKLFVFLADWVVCCSRGIKHEIDRRCKTEKTVTIYNMFDVERIQNDAMIPVELPWKNEEITCLVSVGRDDDAKGFWHLIRIFSHVLHRVPGARLIIIGEGEYKEYKELAKQLGIIDNVLFTGMQKNPYKYVRQGQVYLLTSLNEGFPNGLVEGMSLGLAAVCVDCKTGPAEILLENRREKVFEKYGNSNEERVIWGEYGVLVREMSREKNLQPDITLEEKKMADIVVDLLQDKELLEKYKKASIERAKIFTNENYIQQILNLAEWYGE